ncbi:MAG: hypothetical protein RL711_1665 [Bacteroidota bacterium]
MHYPSKITLGQNHGEELVFEALKQLPENDFTIFYNQKFTAIHPLERAEYETDFIVADHRNGILNALLVIEVKGGDLYFDGKENAWFQNKRKMEKAPTDQASSAMNSLVKRYGFIASNTPFHWLLWFPDAVIRENEWLPNSVSKDRILGSKDLSYTKEAIIAICDKVIQKNGRSGSSSADFNKLKDSLLRSLGFFKPLSQKIKENENTFKILTDNQRKIFRTIEKNQNICIQGPAGSGKTVIAYSKAMGFAEQGLKVLFVCFNKAIVADLRHRLREDENTTALIENIEITNFHFWAQRIAETNPTFIKEKSSDEYFSTYIPNKAKEMIKAPIYDVLIIDEGQDFKQNWLDLLNKVLKPEGRFLFFMDENQDIFNAFQSIPHHRNTTKFELDENCRNTNKIIEKLKAILPNVTMKPMETTPEGELIKYFNCENNTVQLQIIENEITSLIKQKIEPKEIILLTNNKDRISSLRGITHIAGIPLMSSFDKANTKDSNVITHTTINVFKGLEASIVFILDAQNIPSEMSLYTQASRAKQLLYILNVN